MTILGPAIVTGASSAIGRSVAVMLAEEGCAVVASGRDVAQLHEVTDECSAHGMPALAVPADLESVTETERPVAACREAFGAPRILVHAAGLFDWARADEADPDVWDRLLTVNLAAAMRLTRLTLPHLLTYPSSALVFIGSMAGQSYFANNAAYVASKHGLTAFARSTFLDVRQRGVKVCVVSPGNVAAGASLALPAKRHASFLKPGDVADAVRYVLATPLSACPVEVLLEPQFTKAF